MGVAGLVGLHIHPDQLSALLSQGLLKTVRGRGNARRWHHHSEPRSLDS